MLNNSQRKPWCFSDSGYVLHRPVRAPVLGECGLLGSPVHVAALTFPGARVCQAPENTLDREASCAKLLQISQSRTANLAAPSINEPRLRWEDSRRFQSFCVSVQIRDVHISLRAQHRLACMQHVHCKCF